MKQLIVLVVGAFALLVGVAWAAWYYLHPDSKDLPDSPPPLAPTPGLPWFDDVTNQAGIRFQHFDPATPINYIHETFGSGVGWIDYDGDGLLDLFCVQDGPVRPNNTSHHPTNKLYRNRGDGTFEDVTEQVGLARAGFHLGCAVGDYDNDGFDDLVVTYLGGVVLYRNTPDSQGGRRFVDVTTAAGLVNPHFGTSCGWGDVDGDGLLDLYVCNYVELDLDNYTPCWVPGNRKLALSCSPVSFPHTTHRLFRNNGNGTFSDFSQESGVAAAPPAPGLGVVLCDLDGDGRLDIYVANDLKPAYLLHNQGKGRFKEIALFQGCALEGTGVPMAGMGVDAGDLDGTGRPSLFVTNYQNRPNVLFRNRGGLRFLEDSNPSGLGFPSLDRLGFGTVFFDADLDGRLDIAVANGHVQRHARELGGVTYAQKAQLFLGLPGGKFRDVSEQAGPYFHKQYVGRGVATGDFDNDGKPDLAFSNNGGPVVLLRNATHTDNSWLTLELVGDGHQSNRNAVGAQVEIEVGKTKQVRHLNGGGSYLSASSQRLSVGLGQASAADRVTVIWPSGRRQTFIDLRASCFWRLREGNDTPELMKLPTPRL